MKKRTKPKKDPANPKEPDMLAVLLFVFIAAMLAFFAAEGLADWVK